MVGLLDAPPATTRPRIRLTQRRRLLAFVEAIGYGLLAVGAYYGLKFAFAFSRLEYL